MGQMPERQYIEATALQIESQEESQSLEMRYFDKAALVFFNPRPKAQHQHGRARAYLPGWIRSADARPSA
jgi:hypothetical protein